MPKLQVFDVEGGGRLAVFWCPGCRQHHTFNIERPQRPCWTWNGDKEKPTFTPSLLYPTKEVRCHLHLRNGVIEYCDDCGHNLKGTKVPLPDIPPDEVWPETSMPSG